MFMSKSVWLQQLDANARPAVRWTPARFLLVGGTVLIVLGLSGILGISESLSRSDLLNPPYWINWLHLSVGASGALVALKGSPNIQRGMAFVPAVLASALGICGLAWNLYRWYGQVSEPLDLSEPIAHICVGTMASWAVWHTRPRST
jgi:hypothetical protein